MKTTIIILYFVTIFNSCWIFIFMKLCTMDSSEKLNMDERLYKYEESSQHWKSKENLKINRKTILIYSNSYWFRKTAWNTLFIRMLTNDCPICECDLVYDLSLMATADAVVFTLQSLHFYNYSFPKRVKYNQPWIFFNVEAPPITKKANYTQLNDKFNWTMTYRRDSDIVMPYGRVLNSPEKVNKFESKNVWKDKTESLFAVWMVSHCRTFSNRELLAQELRRFVKLDVYGKCGDKKCGLEMGIKNVKEQNVNNCLKKMSKYMFYFAFENVICTDYVTEKLFLPLKFDIIPVVLGGADYKFLAPPHSVINALDFQTSKLLAEYLILVANNESLYNSDHVLAQAVETKTTGQKVYHDMKTWFVNGSNCLNSGYVFDYYRPYKSLLETMSSQLNGQMLNKQ